MILIFQKHHALLCHLAVKHTELLFVRFHKFNCIIRIVLRLFQNAKLHAAGKQID